MWHGDGRACAGILWCRCHSLVHSETCRKTGERSQEWGQRRIQLLVSRFSFQDDGTYHQAFYWQKLESYSKCQWITFLSVICPWFTTQQNDFLLVNPMFETEHYCVVGAMSGRVFLATTEPRYLARLLRHSEKMAAAHHCTAPAQWERQGVCTAIVKIFWLIRNNLETRKTQRFFKQTPMQVDPFLACRILIYFRTAEKKAKENANGPG